MALGGQASMASDLRKHRSSSLVREGHLRTKCGLFADRDLASCPFVRAA